MYCQAVDHGNSYKILLDVLSGSWECQESKDDAQHNKNKVSEKSVCCVNYGV